MKTQALQAQKVKKAMLFFWLVFSPFPLAAETIFLHGFEDPVPCGPDFEPMLIDQEGFNYCLELEYGIPQIGEPLVVTGRAYHQNRVYRIDISGDYPGNFTNSLCNTHYCEISIEVTQNFSGPRNLSLGFFSPNPTPPGRYLVDRLVEQLDFPCNQQFCPPNPEFIEFFTWMRAAGYDECVVGKYLEQIRGINERQILESFVDLNGQIDSNVINVKFYDIIPSDALATYQSMAAGAAPGCVIDSKPEWPFCPSPGVSADYLFLQQHMRDSFGLEINLVYEQRLVDHVATFGGPPTEFQGTGEYNFNITELNNYIDTLDDGSIAHFAIKEYDGKSMRDLTGSRLGVAIHYNEPTEPIPAIAYTHEWGHAIGMLHSFYSDENSVRRFVGLDGVMSNTYRAWTTLKDPTDPMERFAMKPVIGEFTDVLTFTDGYTAPHLGTTYLGSCSEVDLGFTGSTVDGDQLNLGIKNSGGAATGYYTLSWYEGCGGGALLGEENMPFLAGGDILVITGQPPDELASGSIEYILDADGQVTESDESNNTICIPQLP